MLKKMLTAILISITIYFAIALGLIFSQFSENLVGTSLDFSRQAAHGSKEPVQLETYAGMDGTKLGVRHYKSVTAGVPLVVLVHGSGWHGGAYDPLARRIADGGLADVVVPDLRGHGPNPQRRGDIDHIGQFEDDLAVLIKLNAKPGQKVVLIGHSSGGGLTIRFAGGEYGSLLSGAVLLAPYLHHNAPTMRPNSGGWSRSLIRRIIGLSMLNTVGVTALNHLNIIDFMFPKEVLDSPQGASATRHYSYRLNTSFAPRSDYLKDVAKLPPFLLVVGRNDEAFKAEEFEATMKPANSDGRYLLLDDTSHLDVVYSNDTLKAIAGYLDKLKN